MKIIPFIPLFLFLIACNAAYERFDPDTPNETPKIFAQSLISPNNEHVGYCALSPDGSELYYAITNDDWTVSRIIRIHADDLEIRDTLNFTSGNYEGEPFLTNDGRTLYFMAIIPPAPGEMWNSNLYRVDKNENGWQKPEKLDSVVNSRASEWHMSLTNNNVMYFTSEREKNTSALFGDLYRVELREGNFVNLEKLPSPINTEFNDSDPLIAPDESFMIFHSNRPGGVGQHDLYITFKVSGKWSDPINMGSKINTDGWEMAPTMTPDGKYLLYTHRQSIVTKIPAKILWVSTSILQEFRKKAETRSQSTK